MEYKFDARRILSGHDDIDIDIDIDENDECCKKDEFSKNGMVAIYADGRVVSNIEKDGNDLIVTTILKENNNLVLWADGWLYQSNPKMPEKGKRAHQWQAMPLDGVSRNLVAPESWRSWSV